MAELRARATRPSATWSSCAWTASRDLDVAGALAGRRRPVIVTCRPRGKAGGSTAARKSGSRSSPRPLRSGAEYVDVEWRADWRDVPRGAGTRLVLSHHDFDGVPADLRRPRATRCARAGADVVKVAVTRERGWTTA